MFTLTNRPLVTTYFFDIMDKTKIYYYIYDKKLVEISKNIPNVGNRAAVVQSLIISYNLLKKCKICPCEEATDDDLLSFHSSDYLDCLKKAQLSSDLEKISDSDEVIDFNLGYDCPLFENIYDFGKLIAGSSLTAAKKLVNKHFQLKKKVQSNFVSNLKPKSYLKFKPNLKVLKEKNVFDFPLDFNCEKFKEVEKKKNVSGNAKIYETEVTPVESNILPICINWFGGWHHAERNEAGGFCYINDIVIAIQYLLKYYKRILYIDLDIHHGNGVENAFFFSPKVLTFSLHKYEHGFYPSSGSIKDLGAGKGKFYTVNVPLKNGITDEKYIYIFNKIYRKIIEKYQPDCIVIQCGADCLAGDPLGGFNLTLRGVSKCMELVLNQKLPTMVLGGGGYNLANSARCWAYLTSMILECPISNDIPDNSFLHLFGPEFELKISPSLRKDENSDEYIQTILTSILQNLDKIQLKK